MPALNEVPAVLLAELDFPCTAKAGRASVIGRTKAEMAVVDTFLRSTRHKQKSAFA
jgi:hypothetical protein